MKIKNENALVPPTKADKSIRKANHNSGKQDNYNKPAAENQEKRANNVIEFIEKALQLTDKQFDKFCRRLQEEFKNASTEDYTTILHIICSLDALRNKKGA
ncbi:MAG: hypothetical protein K2J59_08770 [Eubacterium sp.]|nr:hypothetical protein [Eubacterium sp.]